ncbi:MAG: hypothetical protein KatS3mg009_2978 [Acidimicrobiia bacterium]|nr:MAG: hypothetical protein KatS3mg009_2978 [Acidimicrobiia bacterium]
MARPEPRDLVQEIAEARPRAPWRVRTRGEAGGNGTISSILVRSGPGRARGVTGGDGVPGPGSRDGRRAGRATRAVVARVAVALAIVTGAAAGPAGGAPDRAAAEVVGIAATPSGDGYWLVTADGEVRAHGDARVHGRVAAPTHPVVAVAASATGRGYWLAAADGGIFAFGDARYLGSTGGLRLNRPIVGIAPTPTGRGYWLAAADGGIFAFGDARYLGSTGGLRLNRPIVGIAPTPTGRGYWLAAADGGIFAFGDARFHGSTGGLRLNRPIVGIAPTPTGRGYWLAAADGGIFAFGDARYLGAAPPALAPAVAVTAAGANGYRVASASGAVHTPGAAVRGADPATAVAADLFERVNAERRARGLRPLAWDAGLAELARAWARHLAATGTLRHQDLGALLGDPRLLGRFRAASENLYAGTGGSADSGSAHGALMASDGHRQAMLVPELQYAGIGAACAGDRLVVVEDFAIGWGAPLPPVRPVPPRLPVAADDGAGPRC